MNKYHFTQAGISQWLSRLYGSTVELQMQEQEFILASLSTWLVLRFKLEQSQIDYLLSLSPEFMSNLAQQIAFTINNRGDIVLDKKTTAEETAERSRDSVKVTSYQSNYNQSGIAFDQTETVRKTLLAEGAEGRLIISIHYRSL